VSRRKRVARLPDRVGAEEVVLELDVGREHAEHALRDGHHLGPDAVPGKTDDSL
jgi:hypothetical protein